MPTVIKSAADSPKILPEARMIAVKIPGAAEGSKMFEMKRCFGIPSERAAVSKDFGTALIASSLVLTRIGKTQIAIVKLPAKIDEFKLNITQKMK